MNRPADANNPQPQSGSPLGGAGPGKMVKYLAVPAVSCCQGAATAAGTVGVAEEYMRKSSIAIIVVVLFVVTAAPIAAFFGSMWYIDRQRVQDAEAAFGPLLSLEPLILSQPIAFHRCCHYIVEFPANCKLSDARVAELWCLNNLPAGKWPAGNDLDLVIKSPRVTDRSIVHLKSIQTLAALDVTGSSITDAGIEELQSALPNVYVIRRKAESANKARSLSESPLGTAGRGSMVN